MLTPDQVESNIKRVEILVSLIEPLERRQAVEVMFVDIGAEYHTAPASSKADYHNAFPGGLAFHSLNVFKNLRKLCDTLVPGAYDVPTMSFLALFHDLGKIGDGAEPFYVLRDNDKEHPYKINQRCQVPSTTERSMYLLQKYGIRMSLQEYSAIRLCDGQYEDANRCWRSNEPDLALLLHWADNWASRQEKADHLQQTTNVGGT